MLLLVSGPGAGAPDAAVPGYEATYRVEYKGIHAGEALFSLQYDPERGIYVFESRTRARGLAKLVRPRPAVERSEFRIENGAIVPQLYTFDDGSRKGKRSTQVIFNWDKGVATSSYKGVTAEIELQGGLLDRMTMQTAVMRDMAQPDGPTDYVLVHRNVLKRYRYELTGTTNTETSLGSLLTKRYVQTRDGSNRKLRVWVAPALNHMAVRMEQERDGKVETVFTLEELTFRD